MLLVEHPAVPLPLAPVRRTPGISCERPICSTLVSFIPLFDRPFLPRKILKLRAVTTSQSRPSLTDVAKELRMVLEPVLEPVLL